MSTMNYAIVENGVVTNIIWLYPDTEFENAVPYGELPVQIGDTYTDGKYYREGREVSRGEAADD